MYFFEFCSFLTLFLKHRKTGEEIFRQEVTKHFNYKVHYNTLKTYFLVVRDKSISMQVVTTIDCRKYCITCAPVEIW